MGSWELEGEQKWCSKRPTLSINDLRGVGDDTDSIQGGFVGPVPNRAQRETEFELLPTYVQLVPDYRGYYA